jgi:hypothetical protein
MYVPAGWTRRTETYTFYVERGRLQSESPPRQTCIKTQHKHNTTRCGDNHAERDG